MNMSLLVSLGLGWLAWKFFFSKPSAAQAGALRVQAASLYQQALAIESIQPEVARSLRSQADSMVVTAEKAEGMR